jgi:hypothetical protein
MIILYEDRTILRAELNEELGFHAEGKRCAVSHGISLRIPSPDLTSVIFMEDTASSATKTFSIFRNPGT